MPHELTELLKWIEKADHDLRTSELAIGFTRPITDTAAFHCQQAVEKYLKALLTYYQVEFPKTHHIQRLLILVSGANPEAAEALNGARWLGPFGVDIRYPGDAAEMLPGDEVKAIEIARFAKQVVLRTLDVR
jgi:HEPN domain-containing protein